GTSHLLAISGLHVAMVASFAIFLTMVIMKSSPYLLLRFNAIRVATFAALAPVIIYALIAGLGISVIRATIMLVVFLLAILLRKDRDLFNNLALAAFIILLISPYALFDVSFQLSFVAVASLIFVSPILTQLFRPSQTDGPTEGKAATISLPRKIFHTLLLFMCVSLSATLGTLPIIASSFNGFSTITLLANLIIVPLLGMVALTMGMAVIITLPLSSTLAGLLVQLTTLTAGLSVTVINFLASLPGAYVIITTPNTVEIICYYLFLIIIVIMIRNKMGGDYPVGGRTAKRPIFLKLALPALIIFFVGDALYLAGREHFRRRLEVTAIDVGQGSATLIGLPAGANMLIDGGGSAMGSFDMGKFVLAPYLWRQRISKLDVVVLTHAHPDHLLGLLHILKYFPVREVWTSDRASATEDYDNFLRIIKERGVRHRIVGGETAPLVINGV
ncbi:MAG: ComEC/Rec2 family competence protein, partial [Deltaproteobacteria bacterium]|nr:ComEC/Rec2 family competence protein [Deltaproteobacteria bacterium]